MCPKLRSNEREMTESNKRRCLRNDPVRDAIFNCLYTSFGGVFVLCDIVLEYAKLVLFIHQGPNEYTILEFYECDLPQSLRVFKHLKPDYSLPEDHQFQIDYSMRQIGNRFRVIMTFEHGDEYCREVIDLEDKSSTTLNILIETGPYGKRPVLVTDTSILFFDMNRHLGDASCMEWDAFTKQSTTYLLKLGGCKDWAIRPLCANEHFIVLQKFDYEGEGWRRILIFKRNGTGVCVLTPTEICICAKESCRLFNNRLTGVFQPDNAAHIFLVYRVLNVDNAVLYLFDVINLENGTTVVHNCCDQPTFQSGNEHCSFYPPLSV